VRTTLVGHASLLVEAGGVRILSDPWWKGPCFGAQWWLYPAPFLEAVHARPIDYLYVSHGHHDHFHPPTLRTFPAGTRVLVAKGLGLVRPLAEMGLDPIELSDDERHELAPGFTCQIMRTDGDDSLMVLSDGRETGINVNDALHSSPRSVQVEFAKRLRDAHGAIDWVFCGYGVASHFPNCYVIPGKDREATAAARQRHFNRAWADVINDLSPRLGLPFAADFVFLEEDLFWANEPTHNNERPTAAFRRAYPASTTQVIDATAGFVIENGAPLVEKLHAPLHSAELRRVFGDSIRRVNREATFDRTDLGRVVSLLRDNVRTGHAYFSSFRGDYRFLIRLRQSGPGIEIDKRGAQISIDLLDPVQSRARRYDLVFTTRLAYLLSSLTTEYGHETLFVGSGGVFEYAHASATRRDLHRELTAMVKPGSDALKPRPGGWRAWLSGLKRRARQLRGERGNDLYDLHAWTVFSR
jgi:Beta-lactamase superfamily domain